MIFFKFNFLEKNIVFFFLIFLSTTLLAQEKCGTVYYNEILQEKKVIIEKDSEFEKFIKEKLQKRQTTQQFRTQQTVYEIPVVIHIIHNGEEIGTGVNLSVERILSQINTLNQDYRRLNPDTILTPPQYLDVAADTEIEFVLARSDPNGFPTTGIVRVQGNRLEWGVSDDEELKLQSYWPAEDYLNIWVTDLATDLLGYAQFPVSDLEGLRFSSNNRLTDGVVIDYEYFGENSDITPRSMGRTTTHEMGHFLGLRHIWGDGNCDKDDFCGDTPTARGPNYTCSRERITCGSRDMFENFMDYTDDHCMNLFTECQKERMRIVLNNSPRRKSLLTSPGLQQPVLVDNDAAIRTVLRPQISSCESIIEPQLEILNAGKNNINQVQVAIFVGNVLVQTINSNINLAPAENGTVTFSPLEFTTKGPHSIRFEIQEVNGVTDQNPTNNLAQRDFYIRTEGVLPLFAEFEEFPEDWLVINTDKRIGWNIVNVAGTNNPAAMLNFYNYDRGIGQLDYLLSPSLDLQDLVSITLKFKVAYATFPEVEEDGLVVVVSKDCGNTFPNADVLYRKNGEELATAPATESAFVPVSRSDWRQESIDLSAYIGNSNIQIAFIGQNGHGNNLYIDDVEIIIKRREDLDLNLLAISDLSVVSCNQYPSPELLIRNDGRETVNTFIAAISVNNESLTPFQYNGPPIGPGQSINLSLPVFDLPDGSYNLSVNLNNINGEVDENQEDNTETLNFIINNNWDIIPLKETFDNLTSLNASDWVVGNPDNDQTWELYEFNNLETSQAAYIRNFTYAAVGQEDWLVSPVLDLRNVPAASMFFSVAHAYNRNYPDALQVRISTDCGETYPTILYSKSGSDLSTETAIEEWFPTAGSQFRREFINLSDYVGEENVRIAFVAITGYGNNLFLNDIEFFVSDNPEPVAAPANNFLLFPNPATEIINASFNLAERQNITLFLYDPLGRLISEKFFPNTLNQTYDFDLTGLADGVYLVRFQGEKFNNTKRFILK